MDSPVGIVFYHIIRVPREFTLCRPHSTTCFNRYHEEFEHYEARRGLQPEAADRRYASKSIFENIAAPFPRNSSPTSREVYRKDLGHRSPNSPPVVSAITSPAVRWCALKAINLSRATHGRHSYTVAAVKPQIPAASRVFFHVTNTTLNRARKIGFCSVLYAPNTRTQLKRRS
jgi:hypothetical protein